MKEIIFSASKKDFRVDTFRAGGKGGQHQNTADTGVRITHIKTGLSAECRETRSQAENKKRAFEKLAKLLVAYYLDQENEQKERPTKVIRSYNEPYQRVKDHLSGFRQTYDEVMKDLGPMIEARRKEYLR